MRPTFHLVSKFLFKVVIATKIRKFSFKVAPVLLYFSSSAAPSNRQSQQQALSDIPAVIVAYQSTAPPSTAQAIQWLQSSQTTTHPKPDFFSLKKWSLQINQHVYNLLLDRSSARDHGLIRCLTDRDANTWLQPCPTENIGLRLIPADCTALSKLHLGEPSSTLIPKLH